MAVKGVSRYRKLLSNISNPLEYVLHKGNRSKRPLQFTTCINPLVFTVTDRMYPLFKEIFMEDVYDIDKLLTYLPDNPVVIDIGANVGFFDILLLSKLKKAKIYAYEPHSTNVEALHKMIEQNPAIHSNIDVFERAVVGTEKTWLDFFVENINNTHVVSSALPGFHEKNLQKISVRCITLPHIFEQNNLEYADILKVDCEGSEYDIFYNTNHKIFDKVKLISMEVHDIDQEQNNIRGMESFLHSVGYKISHRRINGFCHALLAKKQ